MHRTQTACYPLLVSLCLLACAWVCSTQENDALGQALAFLRITVPSDEEASYAPWALRSFEHSISGNGFHKLLKYSISIEWKCSIAGPTDESAELSVPPGSAHSKDSTASPQRCRSMTDRPNGDSDCQLAVLQPLPAALNADVDELRNLQPSVAFTTQLFGTPDAERTEAECSSTVLLVTMPAQRAPPHDGVTAFPMYKALLPHTSAAPGQALHPGTLVASFAVPIHGRYPVPSFIRSGFSNTSFWQRARIAIGSGLSTINIEPPLLAVKCSGTGGNDAEWQAVRSTYRTSEISVISTVVPTGNLTHQPVVVWCTAAAYVIAAAAIVHSAFHKYQ